jgi:uncharacterized membrane protein YphA (DoxX/SURF4 family)
VKSFLTNRWVVLAASLVLGGFFIYASWHKITDPPDFAKIVFNYRLIPWYLISGIAIILPWFELLAAGAVISGLGRRGGALGLFLLLAIFIAALSYNLYRGHPTICGCFSGYEANAAKTPEQKFWEMKIEILRDFGFLLLAGLVLWGSGRSHRRDAAA